MTAPSELTDKEALAAGQAMFETSLSDVRAAFGSTVTHGTNEPCVGKGWARLPGDLQRTWAERARVAWRTVVAMRSGAR